MSNELDVELYKKSGVEKLIADNHRLNVELDAAVTRCAVLLSIAGACLNGTDQVEQIARENPARGYDASAAWSATCKIHRARQDKTLDACLKPLRASIALKDKALEICLSEMGWCPDCGSMMHQTEFTSLHTPTCPIAEALKE